MARLKDRLDHDRQTGDPATLEAIEAILNQPLDMATAKQDLARVEAIKAEYRKQHPDVAVILPDRKSGRVVAYKAHNGNQATALTLSVAIDRFLDRQTSPSGSGYHGGSVGLFAEIHSGVLTVHRRRAGGGGLGRVTLGGLPRPPTD